MTDEQLQRWVEYISLRDFGRPFEHRATFNRRLRATGGRYFLKTHHIEISSAHYQAYGKEESEWKKSSNTNFVITICTGRGGGFVTGFRISSIASKNRRKPLLPSAHPHRTPSEPIRYLLRCRQCEAVYYRKRKVDTSRYVCGRCRGS